MRIFERLFLFCCLLLAVQTARADDTACGPPPAKGEINVYLDKKLTSVTVTDTPSNGALLQFSGCLSYTPKDPKYKYYTGIVAIVYFDQPGHYLGSNGQILTENGQYIAVTQTDGHHFGAGIYLQYALNPPDPVSRTVLIEMDILDCATLDATDCAKSPHSYVTVLNTGPHTKAAPEMIDEAATERSCAHPEARASASLDEEEPSSALDPTPGDALFRLYAEALIFVADDPPVATKPDLRLTHFAVVACLRLVPKNIKAPERAYAAMATAYFFDRSGRAIGLGTQPLAIGGQQLGTLYAPDPKLLEPTNFLTTSGPIHDFGVEVVAPLQDRNNIDRFILIAVTVTCKDEVAVCADRAPHTYYKIVEACAPNLPNSDAIKRNSCPDYGHSTP